ncbi:MAG: hypothetical protein ACW9W4_01215 [Candidatus Nitrosopumilus sp. bin_7KS]
MSKGMWAIFLSVLITGVFTGFELKTGNDVSYVKIFSDVIDSISRSFPQTNQIGEIAKLGLIVLGIIDIVLLVLAILFYRWLGIASSGLAFAGGILVVFSSYSLFGGIMIVIGAIIAIFLDPEGYAKWRDRQT